ncbi:hypothetical protein [Bradyrhizobium sp.]|uniref:hypothetical protein n=1 Tax=Bradyrhizobium sp. TaxID=376 RepID=UPI001ED1A327|nr:hypothetical protein [Bradyrhizobium sp.]MBV9986008.1 hypothetical protein [Bradyrhizobium sp.]
MNDFDDLVRQFLAAEKTAHVRPRWRSKGHPDFAESKMAVGVPESRVVGTVVMIAHKVRLPAKYSWSLLFRGKRILALDVNPSRSHKNLLRKGSVDCTHWQRWPTMDAEEDRREQNFTHWCLDFWKAANIVTTFAVLSPPRGVQLRLIVNEDFDRR